MMFCFREKLIGLLHKALSKSKRFQQKALMPVVVDNLFFSDIAAYFRGYELNEKQLPFVADGECEELKSFRLLYKFEYNPESQKPVFVGVFDESDNSIQLVALIYAQNIDDELENLLKDHKIRILN